MLFPVMMCTVIVTFQNVLRTSSSLKESSELEFLAHRLGILRSVRDIGPRLKIREIDLSTKINV